MSPTTVEFELLAPSGGEERALEKVRVYADNAALARYEDAGGKMLDVVGRGFRVSALGNFLLANFERKPPWVKSHYDVINALPEGGAVRAQKLVLAIFTGSGLFEDDEEKKSASGSGQSPTPSGSGTKPTTG